MRNPYVNLVIGIIFCTGIVFWACGKVYLNIFTKSLPQGIYLKTEGKFERGLFALTCLTSEIAAYGRERGFLGKGFCKTGIIPVGKVIKGVPGDTFVVHNNVLEIGGEKFPISLVDNYGRTMDRFISDGSHTLKAGEFLLISDYVDNSWDSRYWGPVPVEHLLKPLWVVKHGK